MNDDKLTSLLRHHDPAAGKMLDAADRSRILHLAWSRPHTLRFQAAFALVALVLAIVIVHRRTPPKPRPAPAALQIQYATPGGTRVVWTLDPNFHL